MFRKMFKTYRIAKNIGIGNYIGLINNCKRQQNINMYAYITENFNNFLSSLLPPPPPSPLSFSNSFAEIVFLKSPSVFRKKNCEMRSTFISFV